MARTPASKSWIGDPVKEAAYYRATFHLPGAGPLYGDLDRNVVYVKEGLTGALAQRLQKLGFDASRPVYYAKTKAGRWYLGFSPFARGVQICCPDKSIFRKADLDMNHGDIWDYERTRVITFQSGMSAGLGWWPKSVIVWDYSHGRTMRYQLTPVRAEELGRRVPYPTKNGQAGEWCRSGQPTAGFATLRIRN